MNVVLCFVLALGFVVVGSGPRAKGRVAILGDGFAELVLVSRLVLIGCWKE